MSIVTFVVADDSLGPLDVLRAAVEIDCGYKVVATARNGQLAIDACRIYHPDAVLLDVNMPVLGGDQAAATIRAEGLAKYIIMVTLARQARREFHRLGYGFVAKPFNDRALLAREIRKVIDGGTT